jgi:hypothetical protein
MVEYLSGGRIQCTSLEKTNDSGNATLNGTSTNIATAINGVGSIDFDGTSSDYIEFSQALTDELNTATGSGAWTFSCWVYVENTSTDQHTILSKIVAGYSAPNHELNFRQAGSNWQLHFGTSFSGTNTQAIGHTGWTHLILSATNLGTTAVVWKLYVDNQASPVTVTGTEAMLWNSSTALLFGRQNRSGSSSERWFNGQAQEIAFWNKELDSSERSALFNSYAYGTATSSSNTGAKANTVSTSSNLAYYTLNSSSVTNSSPNPSLGSDHPANTRLEVTDTRKIYRRAIPSSPEATKTFTFGTSQVPAGNNVSCVVADSGTKMYLASNNAGDSQAGYQYTLSTAYDVSTASYASKSFNSWGSSDIRGMKVKNNGQYFYRMSDQTNNKTVKRFTASTAYDISTLGSGQSYTYSGTQTGGRDVELSDDGTKMYGLAGNNTVYQYTLSTAWDVTSASSASKSFSCNSQDTAGRNFMITNSGTKLRFLGQANKKIYTYTLSTAWDISTASYDGSSSDISCSFTSNPYGLAGKDDGTWFAVAETDSPYEVQQFDKDAVWKERGTA